MLRTLLVDWIIEMTTKLRTSGETVHLAVSILDRYLALSDITERPTLHLAAITAIFLAYKYEEIYALEVKDCIRLTRRKFSRQKILDMEVEILSTLEFSLTVSTPYKFLKRFMLVTAGSATMKYAAMFYLEKSLLKHDNLTYRPSLLAAGACCLAINHPELLAESDDHSEYPGVVCCLFRAPSFLVAHSAWLRSHRYSPTNS